MTEVPATVMPLKRSMIVEQVGQIIGVFNIDRSTPHSGETRARVLTEPSAEVGVWAIAAGGTLSDLSFNVLTVASEMFDAAGAPANNRVDFTLSAMARWMWGSAGRSATVRKRLIDAMGELMRTSVVVVGVDPYSRKPTPEAIWEVQLLEAYGFTGDLAAVRAAASHQSPDAVRRAALARLGSQHGTATFSIVLPNWLATSIRDGAGQILNGDVQLTLRGQSKRIWAQLEADHSRWTDHHLPAAATGRALRTAAAKLASDPPATPVTPGQPVRVLRLALTTETYQALGLVTKNRKRNLELAAKAIEATDPSYLYAAVVPTPTRDKRQFELHLVRAAGAFMHQRLRAAERHLAQEARPAA